MLIVKRPSRPLTPVRFRSPDSMTISASASRPLDGARDLDAVDAGELHVVLGGGVRVDDAHLLAERLERVGHRQLRSDRVAVGAGVRGNQESLARVNRIADLGRSRSLSSCGCRLDVVGGRAAGRPPRPSSPGGSARRGRAGRPTCRRRTRAPARAGAARAARSGGAGTARRGRAPCPSPAAPSRRRATCSRRARAAGRA